MSAELRTLKSPSCQVKNKLYRRNFKEQHFGWGRRASFPRITGNNSFNSNNNYSNKKINFKNIQSNISNEPSNYNYKNIPTAIGACFASLLLGGHLFISFLLSIVIIFLSLML